MYCFLGGLLYVLLWADPFVTIAAELGLFTEQPMNRTAPEGTNATFNCSISNSNFSIQWRANDRDVSHTIIRDRGILIGNSGKQLIVLASQENNNTSVTCIALSSSSHCISERAFLIVVASGEDATPSTVNSTITVTPLSTISIASKEYSVSSFLKPTTSTTTLNTISITAVSKEHSISPSHKPTPHTPNTIPTGWIVVIAFFAFAIITVFIVFIVGCGIYLFKKTKKGTLPVSSNGTPQGHVMGDSNGTTSRLKDTDSK